MDVTRLPVWLNADGTEHGRLQALSCSLDLSVSDLPKATITIRSADEIPSTHDFVEIFTEHGSAGIFRVVSSTYRYGQTCQLQLIGAADTLSDDIWPETAEEATRTVAEWIQLILAKQTTTRWQAGSCALNASVKMKVNYSELWAMLEDVKGARPGYRWSYDFSTSPWTLSLVQMPDEISSEFRVTRNIESAQITVSDQQMCNRLVFTVTDGSSDGTPVVTVYDDTASQQKYGIRTRCTDIKTDEIPIGMSAADYARHLLSEHAVPDFAIVINGEDLWKLTGTSIDHFELGYLCRAVLPEYGETIEERVVALNYPNVIQEPHSVRVSLSSELPNITGSVASAKRVASAVKAARGGGGGGGKADKDSWAKVLTDVIEATDGTGIKQMWQSGIEMTSHGGLRLFSLYQGVASLDSELNITNEAITSEVSRASEQEGLLYSSITQTAEAITSEVSRATAAEGEMSSRITQTADAITSEVTRATSAEGTLSSRITQTAEQIALKVSKGDVSTQLAVECGNVSITGGNLVVDGYITSSSLETAFANLGMAHIPELSVEANNGFTYMTQTVKWCDFKVDGRLVQEFLGTGDINFSIPSVTVTLDDSGWIINDASTGDYTRTFTPQKNGVAVTDQVKTISAQTIWNLGWNACRSWVLDHSHSVVEGAHSWNSNDNATALYVAPQSGAAKATGNNQVWRYGGTKTTYYSAPSAK